MELKIIKNKLKPYKSLRHKTFFIMMVNDMRLMGYKSRNANVSGWLIYVYHDDKIADKKIYPIPKDAVDYLNAYIEVARTPVRWYVK